MSPLVRLFWLRENGRDEGTVVRASDLELSLRSRVLPLLREAQANPASGEPLKLYLPYVNRHEYRRRHTIFPRVRFHRVGDEIRPIMSEVREARDYAAHVVLTSPVWAATPEDASIPYFHYWQRVSRGLQRFIRDFAFREYLSEPRRFAFRMLSNSVIAYRTARVFRGHAPFDFTYDFTGYPGCGDSLDDALYWSVRPLERLLSVVSDRLIADRKPELARRYAPIWAHDILLDVRQAPRNLIRLLSMEGALINGVIQLGTLRNEEGIQAFYSALKRYWGKVAGMDLRKIGIPVLQHATYLMTLDAPEQVDNGEPDLFDAGRPQDRYAVSSRRPDLGVAA